MNYASYCATAMIFASHFMMSMELAKQGRIVSFSTCMQAQQVVATIPLELAMHCQQIKTAAIDELFTENLLWPIPGASAQDIIRFTSFLKTAYDTENILSDGAQYVNDVFDDTDLIGLAHIADVLGICDKHFRGPIAQVLASRILKTDATKKERFNSLIEQPILCDVMKAASKTNLVNFEEKLIGPYVNQLTEQHSLQRTVPMLTSLYYNLRNAFTFPVRWLSPLSWSGKITTKPYYFNTETGTIITGWVEEFCESSAEKVTHLCISKKNLDQNITIPFSGFGIGSIEANETESLFICRVSYYLGPFRIVIDLNSETRVIEQRFDRCVFSENDNELYVIKDAEFGIFDIHQKIFTPIELTEREIISGDIKTNKAGTVAVVSERENKIFIGRDKVFKEINCEKLNDKIHAICLHPYEDKIYIAVISSLARQLNGISSAILFCIDINTGKETHLLSDMKGFHSFQFITGDILFIDYFDGDNVFLNVKTGKSWCKKKPKVRVAFTADGTQSIEQITEDNPMMDFIIRVAGIDTSSLDGQSIFSTNKIMAVPLINGNVNAMLERINEGFLSLAELKIAQTDKKDLHLDDVDKAQLANLKPEIKKVVDSAMGANTRWKSWLISCGYYGGISAAILIIALLKNKNILGEATVNKIKMLVLGTAFAHFVIKRAIAQY